MYFKFFRKKKEVSTRKGNMTLCSSMKDYGKEEFFINKANVAKEVLNRFGLPKELTIVEHNNS
jgi:hypothetical protein